MDAIAAAAAARGLILFAHGARDPAWAEPLARLADALRARAPQRLLATAFLERLSPTLPAAIDALVAGGAARIDVLPVFWAANGHVDRELPEMLDAARRRHARVEFTALPTLSGLPGMLEFIAQQVLALTGAGSDTSS